VPEHRKSSLSPCCVPFAKEDCAAVLRTSQNFLERVRVHGPQGPFSALTCPNVEGQTVEGLNAE
jgi:hypothetical protein